MLERIVEAEATGEDMIGRILVANVVFNRMTDEEFPDTVEGVIFHKVNGDYQFSPLSDKRYWKVKVTDETREAVQRALEGEDYSKGAIYFMSRKRTKKSRARWFDDSLEWLFKHGAHEFYKDKE
jgi:N-acetylmuramoyl-L-alanine amidase